MADNYDKLVLDNLNRLYSNLPRDLAGNLPADQDGDRFTFQAFGERCSLTPEGIFCDTGDLSSVTKLLISLYALNADAEIMIPQPWKAFKEVPDSMPYAGAFHSHTQEVLVPWVSRIQEARETITQNLGGGDLAAAPGGDFSLVARPLPKIALCYIFYEPDEDFPASATCLYSSNADRFLPVDALADVGEYTSKKILSLIDARP